MDVFKNEVYRKGPETGRMSMSGTGDAEVGPAEAYGGSSDTLNPEEMFVASINSCVMEVFYYFVEKLSVDVTSYSATAEGTVEKTATGLRFTKVAIRAEVTIGDGGGAERIDELRELAEKYCLVSNSVTCPVEYEVSVVDAREAAH